MSCQFVIIVEKIVGVSQLLLDLEFKNFVFIIIFINVSNVICYFFYVSHCINCFIIQVSSQKVTCMSVIEAKQAFNATITYSQCCTCVNVSNILNMPTMYLLFFHTAFRQGNISVLPFEL
ncbi:Hypothetical_protein [Hexamita inflata]|uniref:Hypothetical_protein n=1 Tax=Hexamita inflata TaxID=28002 RepID=A0ABP1JYX6_9EUKA